MQLAPKDQADFAARARASVAFASAPDQEGTINSALGLTFEDCDLAGRSLTLSVAIQPWMRNPSGSTVHGGVSAAVADHAMGSLAFSMLDCLFTPTVSLSLTYLQPVRVDRRLFITAHLESCGGRLLTLTARAWSQGEAEAAFVATGTFYIIRELQK